MKEEYLKWPWGINDTIENLKETKKNLQIIALNVNADGMGQQDSRLKHWRKADGFQLRRSCQNQKPMYWFRSPTFHCRL